MRALRWSTLAIVAVLAASPAAAQTDHLKCYKIKDPNKLSGLVDLAGPQFGLEAGCKIGKAAHFCVPVTKSVTSLEINKVPTLPLPVYGPPTSEDRICYKVKCPKPLVALPDQVVTDQFHTRTFSKFNAAMLCTPAVKGASFCGDGVIDPGEACDGLALGACTVGCQADCTCTCETACCYVENLAAAPDTECFEYTGTPAQVAAFGANCSGGVIGVPGSLPVGSMVNSTLPGPCLAGPLFGMGCIAGPPGFGNLHVMPPDSSCP